MQVLEQVNAVIGGLFASDIMAREDVSNMSNQESALEEADDSTLYFSPELGNVAFCSAVDGWAFTIQDFSKMYSSRLEIAEEDLTKVLWGDYFYNSKKKVATAGAQEKAKKPMFVQFILENIWNLYDLIAVRKDKEKLPSIAEKLGVKLSPRDLRIGDPKVQLKTLFEQWLPIDTTILDMVTTHIPQPNVMTEERAEHLLCPQNLDFKTFPKETQDLKADFVKCDSKSENVIAFISKMSPVESAHLPRNKPKRLTEDELKERRETVRQRITERKLAVERGDTLEELTKGVEQLAVGESSVKEGTIEEEPEHVFIAFGRVFSGTLKVGQKLFALSPKHDPRKEGLNAQNSPHISEVEITGLYIFMGGELESLDEVPAGNIVGIGGLENHVVKTATLSTTISCPSFSEMNITAQPIFRVALEPENPSDMPQLVKGLKLLNQADACVQVSLQETGEHVITTMGEVHVEKCVRDLEQDYAKIKLNVSKPIVSFRETIVPEATVDMVNEAIVNVEKDITKKIATIHTLNKMGTIRMIALPLPQTLVGVLEKYMNIFKSISNVTQSEPLPEKYRNLIGPIKEQLGKCFAEFDLQGVVDVDKSTLVEKIWSVGPRKCGPNILLNLTNSYQHPNFWNPNEKVTNVDSRSDFNSSFVNGFQLATLSGPLCEEPMQGVCFVVLEWTLTEGDEAESKSQFSGQVITSVKDVCRKAFQNQPQRLVSPMYSCSIIVNAEMLGKMYAVIGRRHGKILSGDLIHGSGNFAVTAILPVIESFNFAQEIRKQTSGLAYPQLVFSHWEVIDVDPFWVPSTEEEYLHFGEKADSANRAKCYMDSVRSRKGLFVEKLIVEHAEKQRTLSKKK